MRAIKVDFSQHTFHLQTCSRAKAGTESHERLHHGFLWQMFSVILPRPFQQPRWNQGNLRSTGQHISEGRLLTGLMQRRVGLVGVPARSWFRMRGLDALSAWLCVPHFDFIAGFMVPIGE